MRSMLITNMVEDLGEEVTSTEVPIPNVSSISFSSTADLTCLKSRVPSCSSNLTTFLQVNESVLRKVLEWCEHHKADPPVSADDDSDSRKKTTDIEEWDQKFMQVDQEMLFEIILVSLSLQVAAISH